MNNSDEQRSASYIGRAKRLMLAPKQEWIAIDAEPMTIGEIFTKWVLLFAAIGPIAGLIGGQLFGHGIFGITFRPSLGIALTMAITSYVMAIIGTYVMALIFNWLAPGFGGAASFVSAVKLAAFSSTAAWLAGIFQLLPGLGWLAILGLYSLYLLYVGGPLLMRIPAAKAMGFTVVSVIAAIVVFLVVGTIAGRVGAMFAPRVTSTSTVSGTIGIPGVGTVDLGKMQAAGEQMEKAAKQAQAGGSAPAVAPATLQALLPATLGAWKRTEIASNGANAGGLGGSHAEAHYANGDQSFELEVTDMAAMGGLAAMASAMNVQSNRQTETGYEKTETINGRLTTEEWDNADKNGKYGVMVAGRFLVEAEGTVPSIDVLKQAVAAVGPDKLEAMAK